MNGSDVLLFVDGVAVGSQRGVEFSEDTAEIDVSNKQAGRAQRVIAGRYSASVSLDALYVPDDTGYQSLQSAMRNGTAVTVVKTESGVTIESASAIVTSLSERDPDQDASTISCDLTIDGEWTAGS